MLAETMIIAKRLFTLFIFSTMTLSIMGQRIEDYPHRLDSLLNCHKDITYFRSPVFAHTDSVYSPEYKCFLYYDTDSICKEFIRRGTYEACTDMMIHFYFAIMPLLSRKKAANEVEKMERMARKYKSAELMKEVEISKVFILSMDSKEHLDFRLKQYKRLLQSFKERKDTIRQTRVMEGMVNNLLYSNRTFEAIEQSMQIVKLAEQIPDNRYAFREHLFFCAGDLYYRYGYYEEAIPLLKKTLKDSCGYSERSVFLARNDLGLYYRAEGQLDLSDQYFRSMLESTSIVHYRGQYDAIAMCNLGKNYLIRKDYPRAKMLLHKGLTLMSKVDSIFSGGAYIALGECYLGEKNHQQTKAMIDTARLCIEAFKSYDQLASLYPLMSKYYASIGNREASIAYMDSTMVWNKAYQKKYNMSYVFHAEKKVYDAEKKAQQEELQVAKMEREKYRNLLSGFAVFSILITGFYIFYIQFRKKKNRSLYQQIVKEERIQTELSKTKKLLEQQISETQPAEPDSAQPVNKVLRNSSVELLPRIEKLMQTEELYTNPSITRRTLADLLNTNENYLANAIREGYNGQTFSEYINSLRLKHSHRLLRNELSDSIEQIALNSGFSSYKYFHKLFREEFGMSPSEFRKISNN